MRAKSNEKSRNDVCVLSSFLSHHFKKYNLTHCTFNKIRFDLTADLADEVRWLTLHRKRVVGLIPQPFQRESVCCCGCVTAWLLHLHKPKTWTLAWLSARKEMRISGSWSFCVAVIILCLTCNPLQPWLQQPTAYFHLLACVTKWMHIGVYVLHICCCCCHEFIVSTRTFLFCSTTNHCTCCTTSGWAGIPNVWILAPASPCELRAPKHSPPPFLSITKPHRVPDAEHSASNKPGCIILTQTRCLEGLFSRGPSDYIRGNNLFHPETLGVLLNPAAFRWPSCMGLLMQLCLFVRLPPWHDVCVWVRQLLLVCYPVYNNKQQQQNKQTKSLIM